MFVANDEAQQQNVHNLFRHERPNVTWTTRERAKETDRW